MSRQWWKYRGPESHLQDCQGPCYDLCMCFHCWWGWTNIPWYRKIRYRIQYLLSNGKSE